MPTSPLSTAAASTSSNPQSPASGSSDAVLQDLVYLATQLGTMPIAAITLMGAGRLHVIAQIGLGRTDLPLQSAFTPATLAKGDANIIADASKDARFSRNVLVTEPPSIRFYAGLPLVTSDGVSAGALEVMDHVPRMLQPHQLSSLRVLARQVVAQLEQTSSVAADAGELGGLRRAHVELGLAYDATLASLANAIDQRDGEAEGHLQRVAELTLRLAHNLGVPEPDLVHVRRGVLLHDIGKLQIPDNVLNKPSELATEEWELMRKHPIFARDMLWPIILLRPALDIPYCHHERWDGEGYPRGLKGEAIPKPARIFAVVDVWDSLQSDRPYRQGWTSQRCAEYINKRSGSDFDPQVVNAFLKMIT